MVAFQTHQIIQGNLLISGFLTPVITPAKTVFPPTSSSEKDLIAGCGTTKAPKSHWLNTAKTHMASYLVVCHLEHLAAKIITARKEDR